MGMQLPSSLAVHFEGPTELIPELENVPQPEEPPMREFVRSLAAALSVACLAASVAIVPTGSALAQAKMAPAPQVAPAQPH